MPNAESSAIEARHGHGYSTIAGIATISPWTVSRAKAMPSTTSQGARFGGRVRGHMVRSKTITQTLTPEEATSSDNETPIPGTGTFIYSYTFVSIIMPKNNRMAAPVIQ
eukprot:482175-Amphidinium_carterae.1